MSNLMQRRNLKITNRINGSSDTSIRLNRNIEHVDNKYPGNKHKSESIISPQTTPLSTKSNMECNKTTATYVNSCKSSTNYHLSKRNSGALHTSTPIDRNIEDVDYRYFENKRKNESTISPPTTPISNKSNIECNKSPTNYVKSSKFSANDRLTKRYSGCLHSSILVNRNTDVDYRYFDKCRNQSTISQSTTPISSKSNIECNKIPTNYVTLSKFSANDRFPRRNSDSSHMNIPGNRNIEDADHRYSRNKRKNESPISPTTPILNKSDIQSNKTISCVTSSRFSANNRLKKYREALDIKKNQFVKVHQVFNESTTTHECETNTNIHNRDLNLKSPDVLRKRPLSKDAELSDECPKKKVKIAENIATFNSNGENSLHEEGCNMDWSPIDQDEVVSNIQKFREKCIEKSSLQDVISHSNEANTTNVSETEEPLYIVIDTNIFISHLKLVKDILTGGYELRRPILYVPWMVIQELDYFKDGRTDSSAMIHAAKKAITFINCTLMDKHSQLKGQTVEEALNHKTSSPNADDNIVFCCLHLKEAGKSVILLSNDTNLRNKALFNEIKAYGPKDILAQIKELAVNEENRHKLNRINSLLTTMCTEIILSEMEEAYGSLVDRFITKPPWDFKQCLIYIQRFWKPVFSLKISQKQCLMSIEDLLKLIQTGQDTSRQQNMDEYVKLCFSMCVYFKNCLSKYQRSVIACINHMQKVLR